MFQSERAIVTGRAHLEPTHFDEMPALSAGGSATGRGALGIAIEELKLGAAETGGDNRGSFVAKYLNGLAPEGSNWCAGFVCWCFAQNPPLTFTYTVGARALFSEMMRKKWTYALSEGFIPEPGGPTLGPGDLVFWWRVRANGWQGHVGIVHHAAHGILHTIEGNRGPRVAGFSYTQSTMKALLGFARIP